jgi:hypothetical protein
LNFSRIEPFTPIVEYMIALRRSRFGAALRVGAKVSAARRSRSFSGSASVHGEDFR